MLIFLFGELVLQQREVVPVRSEYSKQGHEAYFSAGLALTVTTHVQSKVVLRAGLCNVHSVVWTTSNSDSHPSLFKINKLRVWASFSLKNSTTPASFSFETKTDVYENAEWFLVSHTD